MGFTTFTWLYPNADEIAHAATSAAPQRRRTGLFRIKVESIGRL
jgi:hypothetical protein